MSQVLFYLACFLAIVFFVGVLVAWVREGRRFKQSKRRRRASVNRYVGAGSNQTTGSVPVTKQCEIGQVRPSGIRTESTQADDEGKEGPI